VAKVGAGPTQDQGKHLCLLFFVLQEKTPSCLACFVALRCSATKKATTPAVAFFFLLWNYTAEKRKKRWRRHGYRRLLLVFVLLCSAAKKATATAVAFFLLLWSCATAQHSEEGDSNKVVVAFFFFFVLQCKKARRRRRRAAVAFFFICFVA